MKHWKKAVTLCLVIGVVVALALPLWAEEAAKININKASVAELMNLKGIGPEYAERIVEYRDKHGSFEKVEDIMSVSGIGLKTFEAIKDLICVE